MALLAKVGSFSTSTSAAGTQGSITGVGFQPKVVMFFWGGETATSNSFTGGHIQRGFGVALSATARFAVAGQSEDGQGTSDTDRNHRDDACISSITTAGGLDGLMDLVSMDTDGFTIVVDDAFANSLRVHYLALGGSDITDVAIGNFQEPASAGNQSITAPGFQPDFLLLVSNDHNTAPPTAGATHNTLAIGVASGPSNQGMMLDVDQNGVTPPNSFGYSRIGEIWAGWTAPTIGINSRTSLASFDANGFTLNWAERASSRYLHYLVIKGGQFHVGSYVTSTSNGATIQETGVGFTPVGVLQFSSGKAENASDTPSDLGRWNIGAFTSPTERGAQSVFSEDGVTSDLERSIRFDAALVNIDATPAEVGLVDVQSIDTDGFTMVMDSADIGASLVHYAAFGSEPVAGQVIEVGRIVTRV